LIEGFKFVKDLYMMSGILEEAMGHELKEETANVFI
jgi:hypothetical protein